MKTLVSIMISSFAIGCTEQAQSPKFDPSHSHSETRKQEAKLRLVCVQADSLHSDYTKLTEKIKLMPGVRNVFSSLAGKVLIEFQKGKTPVFVSNIPLAGLDPEQMMNSTSMPELLTNGKIELRGNGLIIGQNYARQYGSSNLEVGDRVLIYTNQLIEEARNSRNSGESLGILPEEFIVVGIFDAGQKEFNNLIICSLFTAQDLFDVDDDVADTFWVETDKPQNLYRVVNQIKRSLGKEFSIGICLGINDAGPTLFPAHVAKDFDNWCKNSAKSNLPPFPSSAEKYLKNNSKKPNFLIQKTNQN